LPKSDVFVGVTQIYTNNNHVDVLETMGSFGFPWFSIGDVVDINWILWDPIVSSGFPLFTMRFPWDMFIRVLT